MPLSDPHGTQLLEQRRCLRAGTRQSGYHLTESTSEGHNSLMAILVLDFKAIRPCGNRLGGKSLKNALQVVLYPLPTV